MKHSDFVLHGIKNFTAREIEKTGAKVSEVDVHTIIMLQKLRTKMGRSILLLENGLTSGDHLSALHPGGRAVDCWFKKRQGAINHKTVFQTAIKVGFRGIGIYYNHELKVYTFHFDTRDDPKFWIGFKMKTKDNWEYRAMILDPKTLKI